MKTTARAGSRSLIFIGRSLLFETIGVFIHLKCYLAGKVLSNGNVTEGTLSGDNMIMQEQ